MSILPLPELPQQDQELTPPTAGLHLSALEAYAGQPGALQGVSFWPRVGARVIDMAIHYIISICAGFSFGLMLAIAAAVQHNHQALRNLHPSPSNIAVFVMSLLGSIFVEAILEGFHGSTPGKLMLGFVVVQEDGSPCRPGAAFIRSFAYLIDSFFFGVVGYFNMQKTPQQQRHGDEWAHTIVCRRSEAAPQNLRGSGIFVMVFLLAAMVDAALVISGLLIKYFG